jgi:hypothetical protein
LQPCDWSSDETIKLVPEIIIFYSKIIIRLSNCHCYIGFKGVDMIRAIFGRVSDCLYIDIILNTIIRRGKDLIIKSTNNESYTFYLYIARLWGQSLLLSYLLLYNPLYTLNVWYQSLIIPTPLQPFIHIKCMISVRHTHFLNFNNYNNIQNIFCVNMF